MKKPIKSLKWLPNVIAIACGFLITETAFADVSAVKNQIPGSAEPGLVGGFVSPNQNNQLIKAAPATKTPEEKQSSLGPKAAQLKFKLNKVVLEGNHIYSARQLQALFKNKINTVITVAQLQDIVQGITNYYRNNGYILSRAILPPQHVHAGIVEIRIIEGYIDHATVIGNPKGAKRIIEVYANKIVKSRPLRINDMERYLRITNEVPGLQVRSILEPSKDNVGASNMDLAAEEKTVNGSLSYDNYGTRYIGPHQITANIAFNSIFRSGDATRIAYSTSSTRKQLNFYDASYQWPVGAEGLNFTLGKNRSVTQPGFVLKDEDIFGEAVTYYGNVQYPLIRTRDQNMSLDGGFSYLDSSVSAFDQLLYMDHLRTIKAGGNYSFADRYLGSNMLGLHVEKGLSILQASTNSNSTTTSRFGGDANFTKLMVQGARQQMIHGRFSAFFMATGQYSFNPLLSSEQFSFGGSQLGRGYDSAEIIGDKGVSGSVELRMDVAPGWYLLQSIQPYIFYDAGMVWNNKNIVDVEHKASATSTGIGTRFVFNNYVTGNLMYTQPLTRKVAAEDLVGRAKNPRIFFSLAAAM